MTSKKAKAKSPSRKSRGKSEADDDSPAGQVIRFIQTRCRIPEGRFVGERVQLREWQKDEIRRIYNNPHGTRRAIVSWGRKNAKTTLAAFLLLAHLCGPRHRPNSQLYSAAQSRDQAAILFGLAAKIVRMSPELRDFVGVRDTAKQIYCSELGTLYRALSADASTAYGLSPSFIVHDELGQVKGPRSELFEALESAVGAQEEPLSICISTQAPTDGDLLSILIDDAKAGHDPRVVVSLHSADPDDDPFSDEAIKKANPAFGDFLNAKEVRAMAEDARRMPSREAEYRNLVLNQRVEASNPFIPRSVWEACAAPVKEFSKDLPLYAGLDLSAVNDLTALVLIGRIDGVWHVQPTFWLPGEGLADKARKDRVPYDLWHQQGYLLAAPGKSVDYEYVAEYLRGVFDKYNIRKLAFDEWGYRHLKPWLLKAGFTEPFLEERFEAFRQGTKSMTPALRVLESEAANGRLAHGGHPVLAMCNANAVIEGTDDARKLSKKKSHGRIDGMVALADAFGVAPLEEAEKPKEYQVLFV
jgi:phage terminase large subunit-like protein